jgi:hypothetical protein
MRAVSVPWRRIAPCAASDCLTAPTQSRSGRGGDTWQAAALKRSLWLPVSLWFQAPWLPVSFPHVRKETGAPMGSQALPPFSAG